MLYYKSWSNKGEDTPAYDTVDRFTSYIEGGINIHKYYFNEKNRFV